MTGTTTYALYALLIFGDGQDTEQRWIGPGGLTAEQCLVQLVARQPSAAVIDLGFGLEAVETVYGCEMEPMNDRENALAVREMFKAAQRGGLAVIERAFVVVAFGGTIVVITLLGMAL